MCWDRTAQLHFKLTPLKAIDPGAKVVEQDKSQTQGQRGPDTLAHSGGHYVSDPCPHEATRDQDQGVKGTVNHRGKVSHPDLRRLVRVTHTSHAGAESRKRHDTQGQRITRTKHSGAESSRPEMLGQTVTEA